MFNVQHITQSDEPTENCHSTLQFPSALQSIVASFSSLFRIYSLYLYCSGSLSLLSSTSFLVSRGSCFQQKNAQINWLYALPAQHQTADRQR